MTSDAPPGAPLAASQVCGLAQGGVRKGLSHLLGVEMRPTSNRVCSEAENLRASHGETEKHHGDTPDTSLTPTVPPYPSTRDTLHPNAPHRTPLYPLHLQSIHCTLQHPVPNCTPTELDWTPSLGGHSPPRDSGILLPLMDKHPQDRLHPAHIPCDARVHPILVNTGLKPISTLTC